MNKVEQMAIEAGVYHQRHFLTVREIREIWAEVRQ